MRLTRRLALLALFALALVALVATAAFATSAQVDPTETATTVTVNGADPVGNYVATSDSVTLTAGGASPVTVDCTSRSTFTMQADGTGALTELWFETCTAGVGTTCVVNNLATSTTTTTAVDMVNGNFTVTGRTATDTTQATFRLDGELDGAGTGSNSGGGTGVTTAQVHGTVVCGGALTLDCRFTTPTGHTTTGSTSTAVHTNTGAKGTWPFSATVEESNNTLTFTDATIDGDTVTTCAGPDMTGTYTLDDPTTTNATTGSTPDGSTDATTAGTDPTRTGGTGNNPDTLTVSP